jgi:hypothetical protein
VEVSLVESVERIQTPLEEMRGLAFRFPVVTKEVSRRQARDHLTRILREEYPPPEMTAEQETLLYLGFLSPGDDLEKMLLDLLEEQVAGFYDPRGRALYLVPGPLAGTLALAHEMAHALMDQHFDLEGLQDAARLDDDRTLALSGLLEGEATMVTTLWALRSAWDPSLPSLADEDMGELMEAAAAGLGDTPPYLRESLLFPYTSGPLWASHVMKKGGGLKALDPYFLEPPESTEQILHPERSLPPRDYPSEIDPSLLDLALPTGTPVVKRNSLGEFGILLLLGGGDSAEAVAAADGWDGDRFVLAGSRGERFLTWITVWDTEPDAMEFEGGISEWLGSRSKSPESASVRRAGRIVVVTEGAGTVHGGAPGRAGILLSRVRDGVRLR